MYTLEETIEKVSDLGVKKAHKSIPAQLTLGFIAGAMIAFGYMAYVKCVSTIEGGLGVVLGAAIFPIGLIVILIAGGELITGNMMVLGTAYFNKKLKIMDLVKNWTVVTIGNVVGALFVAYAFSYLLGNTSVDVIADIAHHKINATPLQIFISGIGCNWFVGLAVWLNVVFKDGISKLFGIWFPVMVFVLLGFQHSVANVYVLGLALFNNSITILDFAYNFVFAYLGNIVGGAIFVGLLYTYVKDKSKAKAIV